MVRQVCAYNEAEYYSVIKRSTLHKSEILMHALRGVELENIIKLDTNSHILYDSIYMKCLEYVNPQKQKVN